MILLMLQLAMASEPVAPRVAIAAIQRDTPDTHSAMFTNGIVRGGGEQYFSLRFAVSGVQITTADGPRYLIGAFGPENNRHCVACKRASTVSYGQCWVYAGVSGERKAKAKPVHHNGRLGFVFMQKGEAATIAGKKGALGTVKPPGTPWD